MPDLIHGKAVSLAPQLRRLTAPNPGMMTGAGTNTYLLGERDVAIVDPGPDIAEHVTAILDAIAERGGRLARIFVTHTHVDHSPACKGLLERVDGDVEVIGALATDNMFQDAHFAPDIKCQHEQWFDTAEYRLRAIATPGHVENHFCFLHEASGTVMTGDHIMNGSTVVIVPPSGDMAAYIASLQCLLNYPVEQLAPGHGDVMANPREVIQGLVDHRLGREAKVVSVLQTRRQGALDELVMQVYDDVDPSLHPIAQFSLLAHLIKLQHDGRASQQDEVWHWV
jgi:glyoxylase-like metal-dependent hydrolase (beta-lactamase superfamily II)